MYRRELTANEAKFVRHVFRDSVSVENLEVLSRVTVSGGFTPRGAIVMGPQSYRVDYIGPDMYAPPDAPGFGHSHLFLHELGHAWQHYTGAPMFRAAARAHREGRRLVKATGADRTPFNRDAATYSYAITPTRPDLLDYNLEQQCEIIADYIAHVMWGRPLQLNQWGGFGTPVPTVAELEGVMRRFMEDPAYAARGGWVRSLRVSVRMAER